MKERKNVSRLRKTRMSEIDEEIAENSGEFCKGGKKGVRFFTGGENNFGFISATPLHGRENLQ